MAWENGTSRVKARRARRASPTVVMVRNIFQTPGSLCKEYYLLIQNISSVYHIVAMRVIKHPGHTYGGFGSVLFRTGV
jgi:hypothetical protein